MNQILNQGQHFAVIMHIHKRVVTERCSGIYKVKDKYLIALLLQQIAGFTQNFRLRVSDYHRAGTFQYIRYAVGSGLACTAAADDEDVGVVLMLIAGTVIVWWLPNAPGVESKPCGMVTSS